ncbi:MAG: hypothetical protein PHF89_04890 [Eubacteriales bacterium]|nr:hypothetical protein [Eubacteriales bacterium]
MCERGNDEFPLKPFYAAVAQRMRMSAAKQSTLKQIASATLLSMIAQAENSVSSV